MALAGHPLAFSVSSDDSAYSEVDGINDANWEYVRDLLETTDFKDTSGAKTRIAGLSDGSIEVSGDYESADTGQALIRSSGVISANLRGANRTVRTASPSVLKSGGGNWCSST